MIVVDAADIGGDVKLSKSFTVDGATVVKDAQTDALKVKQGLTVDQASLLRGDVTMEKSVTVKEKMEVGTSSIRKGLNSTVEDGKRCKIVFAKKATSGRAGPEEFVSMIFARGGACLNATNAVIHPLAETEDACPIGYAWRPTGTPNTPPIIVAVKSDDSEAEICVDDQVEDDVDFKTYNFKDVSGGAVHFEKDGTLRTSGKATLASVRVEGTSELHDLRASGVVHITSLQQSDVNQFSISKNGDLVAEKITAGGDVAISGDVTLAKGLDVVGEARLQDSVKVVNTNHSNAAMVTLSNDGKVEAKKVVVDGVIQQKNLGFSVADDGVVNAKRVDVSGRIMPFFQEQKEVSCTAKDASLLDGPVIFAKGSCDIAFRKWTCTHGAFVDGQQNGYNSMGSCVDTDNVAGNINYELKATCTPSTSIYCEALDSRSQCEYGIPYLPRTPDAVTRCASSTETSCGGIISSVLNTDLKTWTSDGTIALKYCMKGVEQVPASS